MVGRQAQVRRDNLIVCVLSDGFTPIERTMMEGGEPAEILATISRLRPLGAVYR
jgi:hypothetical protein